MDVILRLLGFPSVFVGFGEGVCKGQRFRPYEKVEDTIKRLGNGRSPVCRIPFSIIDLLQRLLVMSDVAQERHEKILTEGLEIFDGHKLVCSR